MPKYIALSIFIGLMAGCASNDKESEQLDLPSFIIPQGMPGDVVTSAKESTIGDFPPLGTVFLFNNPQEAFTVTSTSEDTMVMKELDSGAFMTILKDSWLPPLQWGGEANNTDSGRRLFTPSPDNPKGKLTVGQTYSYFIETRADRPSTIEKNQYDCEVMKFGEIVVPAGKTDSFEILCKEDGIERVLVNWSPTLNFYVRHVLVTSQGPVVRELTQYVKGPK